MGLALANLGVHFVRDMLTGELGSFPVLDKLRHLQWDSIRCCIAITFIILHLLRYFYHYFINHLRVVINCSPEKDVTVAQ